MPLVITACTNRKKAQPLPGYQAKSLRKGSLSEVAGEWCERLRDAQAGLAAADLYGGRSFQEALFASRRLGAPLAIVSAGLGLIRSDKRVPAYSLSAAPGSADSIFARVSDGASPGEWWSAIARASPFASSLASLVEESSGPVLIGLPHSYLKMIAADLRTLGAADKARLRILTAAPVGSIDPELAPFRMPYDARLDGPDSSLKGTKSDFASRAMRHFAAEVVGAEPDGSVEAHAPRVERALAGWRRPASHDRARHDDQTLLKIIADNWDRGHGHSSKLLRILRDDLNIACEQGRFAALMNVLRATRKLAA